jgi:hypothetical protein
VLLCNSSFAIPFGIQGWEYLLIIVGDEFSYLYKHLLFLLLIHNLIVGDDLCVTLNDDLLRNGLGIIDRYWLYLRVGYFLRIS